MSTTTLPSSDLTIVSGKETLYLNPGKACSACVPPYTHPRKWTPDPSSEREERTLVLCFDGTGDSFDKDNSNVVQFLTMLMKDDPLKQLVYYQAGIGTYTSNVLKTPIIERVSQLRDKMFAHSLGEHIQDGYKFLMQNYRFGDQICIFGFSRGAFTARALAGMLQKIGLLPSHNFEQLPFAYAMYERQDEDGLQLSLQFKRTFCVEVRIKFLGVWDTVESAGLFQKHLPFCSSNNAIEHFRHALALDERRVKFIPSFFGGSDPEKTDCVVRRFEQHVNDLHVKGTDVKEVFFAGAHCDVGGGSVANDERHSLARIPLRWMIRECFKTNTGIIFDAHMLMHEVGLDVDIDSGAILDPPEPSSATEECLIEPKSTDVSLRDMLKSSWNWIWGKFSHAHDSGTKFGRDMPISKGECVEELNDALSPIYDQLEKHTYWRIMEYVPWIVGRKCAQLYSPGAARASLFLWNRQQGRVAYRRVAERVKVHRSVRSRMLARSPKGKDKVYLPEIRFPIDGKPRRLKREEWLAEQPKYIEWEN